MNEVLVRFLPPFDCLLVFQNCLDLDGTFQRGELDCVRYEVKKDLEVAMRITIDLLEIGTVLLSILKRHLDPLLAELRVQGLCGLLYDLEQIEVVPVKVKRRILHLSQVQ